MHHQRYPYWSVRVVKSICMTATLAGAPVTIARAGTAAITTAWPVRPAAAADSDTLQPAMPGIPHLPNVVTIVPFYAKPDETEAEQTKVVIPAEVDGRRGNFIVDLGDPDLDLNRTFLQPSPTGGVDTVTDAHRLPDHVGDVPVTWDKVHVTLRIGTLRVADFDDPSIHIPAHPHANATLNHIFGNFSWVFAPRLGNIGLCVLDQFETIIDYTHQRLVLIRLDKAGRRLARVPAYTPKWSAPLIDVPRNAEYYGMQQFWGIAVRPDGTLDLVHPDKNTATRILDTGAPSNNGQVLGYPFLSQLGVVGFNHRTHRFMLYQ